MPAKVHDLRSDVRGAILVLGILLGAMLVSIVFHVASVGQAILWRENAQDAADAVAYEAALWNARGMNGHAVLQIAGRYASGELVGKASLSTSRWLAASATCVRLDTPSLRMIAVMCALTVASETVSS